MMHSFTRASALALISFISFPALSQSPGASPAVSRGNAFNPDVSVNFLTQYQRSSAGADPANGFALREAELQFTADVDPYLRASALFAVAQENGEWGIDPEEVYAETLAVPALTVRAGKFKAALGKHNTLHTHAYPFVDAPYLQTSLLGEEGYNDAGLSAAYLVPGLPWYGEITGQVLGGNSAELFDSPSHEDLSAVVHLKNLWDLSEATTLELGLSGADGTNAAGRATIVGGVDLTLKFRPTVGGKYRSLIWSTEYLVTNHEGRPAGATELAQLKRVDGVATWLLYQFAERWQAGARYDSLGVLNKEDLSAQTRQSAILAFSPSEFSQLRFQYDHENGRDGPAVHKVALQLNVSIGAHPAHAY